MPCLLYITTIDGCRNFRELDIFTNLLYEKYYIA